MEYNYEEHRKLVFTESGVETLRRMEVKIDNALELAGAFMSSNVMTTGDSWTMLACLDYLVETGKIAEVKRHTKENTTMYDLHKPRHDKDGARISQINVYKQSHDKKGGKVVKAWTQGVPIESGAIDQLRNCAAMPFIYKWVAAMPDVHIGKGSTIGSVIPTKGAVMPAAIGVDIGCGMVALPTTLMKDDLPDLDELFTLIGRAVPHGKTFGSRDKGAWDTVPEWIMNVWREELLEGLMKITSKYQHIANRTQRNRNNVHHLGTLGGGNHFIEISLDENDRVWIMIHSGSRGIGNLIGTQFIKTAKAYCKDHFIPLIDKDLAYFPQGTELFDDYLFAVEWAQLFAWQSRLIMLARVQECLEALTGTHEIEIDEENVHCHHNYVAWENHYGENVLITRKGAIRARGDMGIIPGSMGARSFIVRGLGNPESFHSASHGAGRVHSRSAAKKLWNAEDVAKSTEGIVCKKDSSVIDEIPMAYKNINDVMAAQTDLVEPVHTLCQVLCLKG